MYLSSHRALPAQRTVHNTEGILSLDEHRVGCAARWAPTIAEAAPGQITPKPRVETLSPTCFRIQEPFCCESQTMTTRGTFVIFGVVSAMRVSSGFLLAAGLTVASRYGFRLRREKTKEGCKEKDISCAALSLLRN